MKRTDVHLRRANEDDIPLIQRLARQIWYESYAEMLDPKQIEYMLHWMYRNDELRAQLQSGVDWQLVEWQGAVCGYLSTTWHVETRQLELNRLYLDRAHQGKGIGNTLLATVLEKAAALGAHKIHLRVNKRNHRAIRAYHRAGFEIRESLVKEIGQGFIMDDYIMVHELRSKDV